MFAEHADLAFTVGGVVLMVGLLPSLRARVIMPYASTLPIATVLTAWLPFQWALGLEFGAATTAVQAAMWWSLVGLKWRKR